MGADDTISSAAGNLSGKAKELAGKVTDDEGLERQGRLEQAKSSAKDAVEDVKEAAKKTADTVKDAFKN